MFIYFVKMYLIAEQAQAITGCCVVCHRRGETMSSDELLGASVGSLLLLNSDQVIGGKL